MRKTTYLQRFAGVFSV